MQRRTTIIRSILPRLVFMHAAYFALASLPAAGADTPPLKGQRIFVCGHSFHMPMANMLPEIEQVAGIIDRVLLGAFPFVAMTCAI